MCVFEEGVALVLGKVCSHDPGKTVPVIIFIIISFFCFLWVFL